MHDKFVIDSAAAAILFKLTFRYLLFTGAFYFFFYVWRKKRYWASKIQQRYPENKHVLREILYSVTTILIFGIVVVGVSWAGFNGYTLFYKNISDRGWPYLLFSIALMIVLHDTYFYWTHRLMHWKPLFKLVHRTHHLSTNPTPFAAYAFHPIEAFVEIGIIPLIVFTIPYHGIAILVFSIYTLLLNVMGHLGYELFPKGFASHWLFKWHNTSTHHNMHHRLVKCNYGLYFNFWDRIMGTNHPDYEKTYDKVIDLREQGKLERQLNGEDKDVKEPFYQQPLQD
jgi:sterol desaturase/sphingolipid hydroxylase (fatty acid hydroxylase superfamily)